MTPFALGISSRVLVLVACIFALLAPTLGRAAIPTVVLVQPVPGSTDGPAKLTAEDRLGRCIGLHLQEYLEQQAGVQLVDDAWARALLGEQRNPARREPADLRAALRQQVDVDVAVTWGNDAGAVRVTIHTAEGTRELALAPGGSLVGSLATLREALVEPLGLDAQQAAAWRHATPDEDDPTLETRLLTRRLGTVWIYNAGETQLDLMRPFLARLPKSPALAGDMLAAGLVLSSDRRQPQNEKAAVELLRLATLAALGTEAEPAAVALARVTRYGREQIEQEMMEVVRHVGLDEVGALLEGDGGRDAPALGGAGAPRDVMASLLGGKRSAAQQAGGLRVLGALRSDKAWPRYAAAVASADAGVRQATAEAMGRYDDARALPLLRKLADDRDPRVALHASLALHRRGEPTPRLATLARQVADHDAPAAAGGLALAGEASDAALLQRLATSSAAATRHSAVAGLLRLKVAPRPDWLTCGDAAVVEMVAKSGDTAKDAALAATWGRLTRDPYDAVAESARLVLTPGTEADHAERLAFDLDHEHVVIQLRRVAELAEQSDGAARLAGATANHQPLVRAAAIAALAHLDPAATASAATRLLDDDFTVVRVHAAAALAGSAAAQQTADIRDALERETDPVARLDLADALARTEGKPASPPRKPVNTLPADRVTFGYCGVGEYADRSPFGYSYLLSPKLTDAGRVAHDAGRVLLARANETAKNPGHALLSPTRRLQWWVGIASEFAQNLDHLDGVVLGEESMYARPWQLWDEGWRLFCRDAGIDPRTIAGERNRLTAIQQRAFLDWEEHLAVTGFNVMYDYIKLYFGKLRPGFLVGTFMPDQNGPSSADRQWKFDVAGAADCHGGDDARGEGRWVAAGAAGRAAGGGSAGGAGAAGRPGGPGGAGAGDLDAADPGRGGGRAAHQCARAVIIGNSGVGDHGVAAGRAARRACGLPVYHVRYNRYSFAGFPRRQG